MTKILVIDDDASLRTVLRAHLTAAGHTVFEAGDGAEGLLRLQQYGADFVLTDLFMPNRDGFEAIRQIRRDFPTVRVLAMSGGGRFDAADFLRAAQFLGARRALLKPFSAPALLRAIEELQLEVSQPAN